MAFRSGKNENSRGPSIRFPSFTTRSPDGVRIRYFDTGGHLPTLVLANGLGGPVSAWNPYIHRWSEKFRLISWDYRGLYGSLLAHRNNDLSIESHASDLKSVLDAAEVERTSFLGWSMGVQVGLQFYSQSPNRVESLALLNGTFGKPLRGVPLPFSELTVPPLVRGAQRAHKLGARLLRGLSQSRLTLPTAKRLGLVAPTMAQNQFDVMVRDFNDVNLEIYFDLMNRLGEHDAENILSSVTVPTLVITGARDRITPPSYARRIASEISGAELYVIPHATHYAAAEYPELVAGRLEKFMTEHLV